MSSPEEPRRVLPAHPSLEFLRKEAKRRAKADGVKLAHAQRALAHDYGYRNWAAMMRAVTFAGASPLSQAAMRAQVDEVRSLLAGGAAVDGAPDERDTPLFRVCGSDADADKRLEIARLLIEASAFVRRGCTGGATALHAAARRGPAALVRLLLKNGALIWQPDDKGERAHDYAKRGKPLDRDEILYLLADGPRIEDAGFREAVVAIQTGDLAGLQRLLDARPSLLTERAIEPDIGQRDYFSDPMLFWFIANNPTLIPQLPDNIVEITEAMLVRGVAQEDRDYALGLVATNSMMPRGQQVALVRTLVGAGARPGDMLDSLGHRQYAPAVWMLDNGALTLTAPIAAGLGRVQTLPALLDAASPNERAQALGMAVINRQRDAARLCLEAGADPNAFMPCHKHSTPLHQAAIDNDVAMMQLLIAHGARTDIADTLWHGTPLGWAMHGKKAEAIAFLKGLQSTG